MIRLLNNVEREKLRHIFEKEFDSELPDAKQANIIASFDGDGNFEGFLVTEVLLRVGMLAVTPSLRKTARSASVCKDLTRFVITQIPKGASVITIASDEKFDSLFTKLGMREVEGKLFRIDL